MSNEQGTSNVIADLVADLARPTESRGLAKNWFRWWAACTLAFGAITAFLAYNWPTLTLEPADWMHADFIARAGLWLAVFLLAAALAYRSVMPLAEKRGFLAVIAIATVMLVFATWSLRTEASLSHEVRQELDWGRGPCGVFIAIAGATAGLAALGRLRAGASVQPLVSGFWSGVAAGSLGVFFMTLICRHETTAHVLLWHALPTALLAALVSLLARRRLFPAST